MRRALIATLLVCGGYYAGGAIGMAMRLVPGGPSEIWLPQGILLAALLAAPARRWWLYAVALLPTHVRLTADFNPQVPASMMLVQFAGQFVQAAAAAALLRPILGNPPRLDSLRRMGAFIFGGTFLVPLVVQAVVVGIYVASGFVHDFWAPWQQRVLARMAGAVIVAAPILYFAANGLAGIRRRPRRVAELVLLTACLLAAISPGSRATRLISGWSSRRCRSCCGRRFASAPARWACTCWSSCWWRWCARRPVGAHSPPARSPRSSSRCRDSSSSSPSR